jgi:small subunit ribosomal protein S16
MATRLRLQRHGKKGKPFYHVVAADARSPRDGRFIEKVGTYNPNTNPATIEINHERALYWVQNGAEMSETTRALMKYKGVVYHNHLLNGMKKGALTAEQVEAKLEAWMREKSAKIQSKIDQLAGAANQAQQSRLKAEKALNETRLAELEAAARARKAEAEAAARAAAGEAAGEAEDTAEATEEAVEAVGGDAAEVEAPEAAAAGEEAGEAGAGEEAGEAGAGEADAETASEEA